MPSRDVVENANSVLGPKVGDRRVGNPDDLRAGEILGGGLERNKTVEADLHHFPGHLITLSREFTICSHPGADREDEAAHSETSCRWISSTFSTWKVSEEQPTPVMSAWRRV
jgi:hypothetical protein